MTRRRPAGNPGSSSVGNAEPDELLLLLVASALTWMSWTTVHAARWFRTYPLVQLTHTLREEKDCDQDLVFSPTSPLR